MYAAPEVFQGNNYDHRTDIYSLGVSIVSLIVGRPPFEGATTYEILNQIQNKDIRLRDEIAALLPDDLLSLLYEMIEKDPSDRPASMQEVHTRAESILQENQQNLGLSISEMIETGEIESNLNDTYVLRDLALGETAPTQKQQIPSKKSYKLHLTAAIAVMVIASGLIWFNEYGAKGPLNFFATRKEQAQFKRLGKIKVLDSSFDLIKQMPEGDQKEKFKQRFTEIEKLAMRILREQEGQEDIAILIRKFGRKLLHLESSLKSKNYHEAEVDMMILTRILSNQVEKLPKRLPSKSSQD